MESYDSDKMAEGLKDAGWATSSSYVESLKSVMETYGLYRFDGMSLEDFRSGALSADAIVSAAYSQLGVPYVWGGRRRRRPGLQRPHPVLLPARPASRSRETPRLSTPRARRSRSRRRSLATSSTARGTSALHRGRPLHPRAPSGRGREDRERDLELHLRPVVSIGKEQEDGQEDEADGQYALRAPRRS